MITNTQLLNKFERYSRNNSSANRAFGQDVMNQIRRQKAAGYDWPFLEKTLVQESVASQDAYILSRDIQKIRSIAYIRDDFSYRLIEIPTRQRFEQIDFPDFEGIPQWFYLENRTLYLKSTPDSSGDDITINYKKKIIDLTEEDYTTGTIDVVLGSEIISGLGTSWTTDMIGRYIQTPNGCWYEIVDVTASNVLEIEQPYEGVNVSGASYIIGEVDIFPDGMEYLTLYGALADYFQGVDGGAAEAEAWLARATALEDRMEEEYGQKTVDVYIDEMDTYGDYYGSDGRLPISFP